MAEEYPMLINFWKIFIATKVIPFLCLLASVHKQGHTCPFSFCLSVFLFTHTYAYICVCVYVSVYVCERERGREREKIRVCVCVSVHYIVYLCIHISITNVYKKKNAENRSCKEQIAHKQLQFSYLQSIDFGIRLYAWSTQCVLNSLLCK